MPWAALSKYGLEKTGPLEEQTMNRSIYKTISSALLVCMTFAGAYLPLGAEPQNQDRFTLDRSRSSIEFFVDAKLVDVKGYFRSYRLNDFTFDGSRPETFRGGLLIWPASVFTRDRDRDEHLRQDDFFWVEKYPTSQIQLEEVKKRADGLYDFVFTLQIRDKQKQYTVPTKVSWKNEHVYIEGDFQVNRKDFDLNGEHIANLVMNNEVNLRYVIALKDNQK